MSSSASSWRFIISLGETIPFWIFVLLGILLAVGMLLRYVPI